VDTCELPVERNFSRVAPNQTWVADVTEQPVREGTGYDFAVLDADSRWEYRV